MNNLPDDWGSYYRTCPRCGERYHESGTEECACIPCRSCGKMFDPTDEHSEQGCVDCRTCQDCHKLLPVAVPMRECDERICDECWNDRKMRAMR